MAPTTLTPDAKYHPVVIPRHHGNVNVHLANGIVPRGIETVPRGIETVPRGIEIAPREIGIEAEVGVKEVGHVNEDREVVKDVEVAQEIQNDDHHQDQIKTIKRKFG